MDRLKAVIANTRKHSNEQSRRLVADVQRRVSGTSSCGKMSVQESAAILVHLAQCIDNNGNAPVMSKVALILATHLYTNKYDCSKTLANIATKLLSLPTTADMVILQQS